MTFGSLFAGIGGMDLGLERAGMECRWQVEIDPFCRKVLTKHWPDVPKYEDVRDVGSELESVDLICGGFPCQPVSVAGKRLAQDDERWLWPEFARIIRELRPRYALMENVPGLLVRGFGDVLGDLAEAGYDAEWFVLGADDVGAPHRRKRVFVVAHTAGVRFGTIADVCGNDEEGQDGYWGTCVPSKGASGRIRPIPERGFHGVVDGASSEVDRVGALGNAVVPQVAEWIGRRIMELP